MAYLKIVCTVCDTKTGPGKELSEAIQDLYRRRAMRQLKGFNWLEKRLDNAGRHSAHTKANRSECVKGLWRPSYSVGHIIFSLDGLWLNRYEETVPSLFHLAFSLSHTPCTSFWFLIRGVLNLTIIQQIHTTLVFLVPCCWLWKPMMLLRVTFVMWEQ